MLLSISPREMQIKAVFILQGITMSASIKWSNVLWNYTDCTLRWAGRSIHLALHNCWRFCVDCVDFDINQDHRTKYSIKLQIKTQFLTTAHNYKHDLNRFQCKESVFMCLVKTSITLKRLIQKSKFCTPLLDITARLVYLLCCVHTYIHHHKISILSQSHKAQGIIILNSG